MKLKILSGKKLKDEKRKLSDEKKLLTLVKLHDVKIRNQLAYNEQGLALLGYLKNVSRQLKPNIVLKVEDMN